MTQQVVASNFAKNRENVKGGLNVQLFLFPSLSVVLSLRDVLKAVFWINQNGEEQAGGHGPPGLRSDGTAYR